jgi:hypothetical protein
MSRRLRWVVGGLAAVALAAMVWRLTASHRASPSRTAEQRVQALDRSLHALEDGEREMARDTWDPDYVVSMVGRNPEALFAWVRDNTYWIPYRGELRGCVGVLMDRQGNSLDRAILLATLLEKAGHTARLAHGELPREQAIDLLPKLVADRAIAFAPQEPQEPTRAADLGVHRVAERYQLDGGAINSTLQAQAQLVSRIFSELHARVTDQTARLLKAVERPKEEEVWHRTLSAAIAALTDHWWVQRQDGPNWVDLDLLGEPGRLSGALVPANQTMTGKDVPAEVHHEITVRVIAEQWASGKLSEYKALEQILRPADLIGQDLALQFWPTEWIANEKPATPGRDWKTEVLAQKEWDAVLAIGRDVVAVTTLQDSGDDPSARMKGGAFGGIASAFSSSMNRSRQAPKHQGAKTLSAVWLEYEIRVPGEKPRSIRRTVFDLLGPAARATPSPALALDDFKKLTRSLALTMQTEIMPVACGLAPEFVNHLLSQNLLANRDLFKFVLRGTLPGGIAGLEQLFDRSAPPLSPLYALALARVQWGEQDETFIDSPNLLTRHSYAASSGKEMVWRDATDIVANEIGVTLMARDGFRARLAQGVLDTNAESLLRTAAIAFGNPGDAFAASRRWTAITSDQDTAALAQLDLPDDVRKQIATDLASGYSIVAPDSAVPLQREPFVGWWRINRSTGDALGLGQNGWGQAMQEESPQYTRAAQQAPKYRRWYTFKVTFAMNMGWCVTPLVLQAARDVPKLGAGMAIWEGAVKPTITECAPESVLVAGATAWLLPVRAAQVGVPAARRIAGGPRGPKPPPKAPVDPCPEGGGASPEAKSVAPPRSPETHGAGPVDPEPVSPKAPTPTLEEIHAAEQAMEQRYSEQSKATQDYVKYRQNSPEYQQSNLPREGPPQPYDPIQAENLWDAAQKAEIAWNKAYNRWERLAIRWKQAHGTWPSGGCAFDKTLPGGPALDETVPAAEALGLGGASQALGGPR